MLHTLKKRAKSANPHNPQKTSLGLPAVDTDFYNPTVYQAGVPLSDGALPPPRATGGRGKIFLARAGARVGGIAALSGVLSLPFPVGAESNPTVTRVARAEIA